MSLWQSIFCGSGLYCSPWEFFYFANWKLTTMNRVCCLFLVRWVLLRWLGSFASGSIITEAVTTAPGGVAEACYCQQRQCRNRCVFSSHRNVSNQHSVGSDERSEYSNQAICWARLSPKRPLRENVFWQSFYEYFGATVLPISWNVILGVVLELMKQLDWRRTERNGEVFVTSPTLYWKFWLTLLTR